MSNDKSVIKEIRLKNLTHRILLFKVTQGHRHRHGSICQLWLPILTFRSNHGPISYCFRDKIANFSHPVYLTPPLSNGFLLELWVQALGEKNRMRGYRAQKELTISLVIWI